MKTYFVAAAVALAAAGAAHAEPFNGGYVGVQLNRDAYEVKADNVGGQFSFDGLSGNGIGGGVYLGADTNYSSNFFAGIEVNGNISSASISAAIAGLGSGKVKAKESYGFSGRLGAIFAQNTGLYGRVGYQRTNFKARFTDGATTLRGSDWQDALVYGAGLESKLGTKASVRVEYTIEDYGSAGFNAAASDLAGADVNGFHVDNNKLSLGMSYHF